jgi:(p)ppGpp synthase/HD superfamily hydrolase
MCHRFSLCARACVCVCVCVLTRYMSPLQARDEYRREQDSDKVREVDAVHGARLVKLTDRLHKMRGLWARPAEQRLAYANETLLVWVLLAERAQLWGLKVIATLL